MCCCRLHRHQVHLISYGFVSFSLITTGLVFTVFAIFQKDSQIGKVWLAGPTTMVVGLVLCGKVIIDWGPAMMHGRQGSMDSRVMDQLTVTNALPTGGIILNGVASQLKAPLHFDNLLPSQEHNQRNSLLPLSASLSSTQLTGKTVGSSPGAEAKAGQAGAIDCIVYAQYDSISNNNHNGTLALRPMEESTQTSHNSMYYYLKPASSPVATQTVTTTDQFTQCSCVDYESGGMSPVQVFSARDKLAKWVQNGMNYGSMDVRARSQKQLYQGEIFVLNERTHLI